MLTATERSTAIGVFYNHADARRAVSELRQAGFSGSETGVVSRNTGDNTVDDSTKATIGATTGVATGAGVGVLWGLGIAAGVLPAIGPVIAGGTLAAILASAATGAAVAGVAGTLIGLGIPDDEAEHYETEFQAGRTIVTVKAQPNRYAQAMGIMNRAGAIANQYS